MSPVTHQERDELCIYFRAIRGIAGCIEAAACGQQIPEAPFLVNDNAIPFACEGLDLLFGLLEQKIDNVIAKYHDALEAK